MQIDDSARAERLAYYKAWRAANPEKVRKHNKNYWRRRAERKLQEQQSTEKHGESYADRNNE